MDSPANIRFLSVRRRRFEALAKVAGLLLAVGLFALLVLVRVVPWRDQFYNTDLLYLPTLFQDMASGVDVRFWRPPPAPYYFPDMIIYGVSWLITRNNHLAIALNGVLQALLFTGGLGYLYRQALRLQLADAFSLAAVTSALYLTFIPWLAPAVPYLFLTTTHTGVAIVLPYLLALCIILLQAARPRILLLGALLVGFAGLLYTSDRLALVQLILPAAIASAVMGWLGTTTWKRAGLVIGLMVAAGLQAELVYNPPAWYPDSTSYGAISRTGLQMGLSGLLSWLRYSAANQPLIPMAWLGFSMVCLSIAFSAVIQRMKSKQPPEGHGFFFPFFYLALNLVTMTAVVLSGTFSERVSERYLTPLLLFPLFFGWPLVYHHLPIHNRIVARTPLQRRAVLLLVGLLVFLSPYIIRAGRLQSYVDYYPELVQCMDGAFQTWNLQEGLSNYWDAKYFQFLSRQEMRIVQVDPYLIPYPWINNPAWYAGLRPNFVIVDEVDPSRGLRLDAKQIISRFGEPAEVATCASRIILIYNRPTDSAFHALVDGNPGMVPLFPGQQASFNPAVLPGEVGQIAETGRVVESGPADYLNLGPYAFLLPGQYQFTIHYSTNTGGGWEVALTENDAITTIEYGNLPPDQTQFSGEFTLTEAGLVEIRTLYSGQGRLAVDSINLVRVE